MDKQLLEQMPDEIRKQIKDAANSEMGVYKNATIYYSFIKGAEFGYNIAGATSSSTVKAKDERIKQLEDGIKWALDNPQSVFVFNELQKLL